MVVKVALAQYPIGFFESFDEWKEHTKKWVKEACLAHADLLVFPEYGSMELASLLPEEKRSDLKKSIEAMQDFLLDFRAHFSRLSERLDCVIVAPSFPVKTENGFVNRSFVFSPYSESYQDKFFMTRFEKEEWGIESGEKILRVFECRGKKFGIQICYDIEFPIGSALLAANGAQIIVAPSCTETLKGASRVHIGARARALEQQVYSLVSQTVNDAIWSPAVDVNYGFTAAYASPDLNQPDDGILFQSEAQKPGWSYVVLNPENNTEIREKGQVFNFKDMQSILMKCDFEIEVEKVILK